MSNWLKLNLSERRKPHLKKCLHNTGLWACLLDSFLISDRGSPAVHCGWRLLFICVPEFYSNADWTSHEKGASKQYSSSVSWIFSCLSVCPKFPHRWMVTCKYKKTNCPMFKLLLIMIFHSSSNNFKILFLSTFCPMFPFPQVSFPLPVSLLHTLHNCNYVLKYKTNKLKSIYNSFGSKQYFCSLPLLYGSCITLNTLYLLSKVEMHISDFILRMYNFALIDSTF